MSSELGQLVEGSRVHVANSVGKDIILEKRAGIISLALKNIKNITFLIKPVSLKPQWKRTALRGECLQ